MPRRQITSMRARRADSIKAIGQLREAIAEGYPWLHQRGEVPGFFDLLGLISGHWFGFSDFVDENDDESCRAVWQELRHGILLEHAKRRPGTRPAAWWRYDAPELRRVVGRDIDEDEENGHDDGRLPAAEDPNLPDWAKGKTYFGKPTVADGYVYESQREYLERLNLITEGEKELFKHFDICFVRVSAGAYGKCEECLTDAREIAKEIGFDLDGAILPDEIFWLPEDLVFDCEHREYGRQPGIFTPDDGR
jgi:hypothetical protein